MRNNEIKRQKLKKLIELRDQASSDEQAKLSEGLRQVRGAAPWKTSDTRSGNAA